MYLFVCLCFHLLHFMIGAVCFRSYNYNAASKECELNDSGPADRQTLNEQIDDQDWEYVWY